MPKVNKKTHAPADAASGGVAHESGAAGVARKKVTKATLHLGSIPYPMYVARLLGSRLKRYPVLRKEVAPSIDMSSKASALVGIVASRVQEFLQESAHRHMRDAEKSTLMLSHAQQATRRLFSDRILRDDAMQAGQQAVAAYEASLRSDEAGAHADADADAGADADADAHASASPASALSDE